MAYTLMTLALMAGRTGTTFSDKFTFPTSLPLMSLFPCAPSPQAQSSRKEGKVQVQQVPETVVVKGDTLRIGVVGDEDKASRRYYGVRTINFQYPRVPGIYSTVFAWL